MFCVKVDRCDDDPSIGGTGRLPPTLRLTVLRRGELGDRMDILWLLERWKFQTNRHEYCLYVGFIPCQNEDICTQGGDTGLCACETGPYP